MQTRALTKHRTFLRPSEPIFDEAFSRTTEQKLTEYFGKLLETPLQDVRIENNAHAQKLCESAAATALAVENRVFLSVQFQELEHSQKFRVLAHEFAHLAQKEKFRSGLSIPCAESLAEVEADIAADELVSGGRYRCTISSEYRSPSAWGCVGHFWSVWIAYLNAQADEKDAFKTALYCWMPDQVHELDAFHLYVQYMLNEVGRSGALSREFVPAKRFLEFSKQSETERTYYEKIHKGIHCLNGRNAESETKFRRKALVDRNLPFILRGVAHHSFGDSYAHRQLDSPGQMYGAGRGHAFDGTHPDEVSHPKAGETYRNYLIALQKVACEWTGLSPIVPIDSLVLAIDPMLHESCRTMHTPLRSDAQILKLSQLRCAADEGACAEHLKTIATVAVGRPMTRLWYNPIRDPKPWRDYYQEHMALIEVNYPPKGSREANMKELLKLIVQQAGNWSISPR